jgi:hypothetical protein
LHLPGDPADVSKVELCVCFLYLAHVKPSPWLVNSAPQHPVHVDMLAGSAGTTAADGMQRLDVTCHPPPTTLHHGHRRQLQMHLNSKAQLLPCAAPRVAVPMLTTYVMFAASAAAAAAAAAVSAIAISILCNE